MTSLADLPLLWFSWVVTYAMHSTLWLGGTWLWWRWHKPAPAAVRCLAWRWALCAGLLTSTGQLATGLTPRWYAAPAAESPRLAVDSQPTPRSVPVRPAASTGNTVERPDIWSGGEPVSARSTPATHSLPQQEPSPAALETLVANQEVHLPLVPRAQPAVTEPAVSGVEARQLRRLWSVLASACGGLCAGLLLWGLLRWSCDHWHLSRRLRRWPAVTHGTAHDVLEDLRRTAGLRRSVTLRQSSDDIEPGAAGWWRWTIILPQRMLQTFSATELRAVLAHELAHLVRHDPFWLWFGRVVSGVFCWQPLNRLACREFQRAAESLCDSQAVAWSVDRWALARSLTTVAEWKLSRQNVLAGLASDREPPQFVQRVEQLLSEKPLTPVCLAPAQSRRLWRTGAVLTLLMLLVAPGWALVKEAAAHAPGTGSKTGTSSRTTRTDADAEIARVLPQEFSDVRPAEELSVQTGPGLEWEWELDRPAQFDRGWIIEFQAVVTELTLLERELARWADEPWARELQARRGQLQRRLAQLRDRLDQWERLAGGAGLESDKFSAVMLPVSPGQ